jgi:outer membrane protein
MKGYGRIVLISFLMCLVTGISVYYLLQKQDKKIGVIDAVKLFDQFNMKKELEAKAKVKLQAMGKQMDSVNNLFKMAQAIKNQEEEKKMEYLVNYYKATLNKAYEQSNHDINEQVWKHLNKALDDYGKKKALHLIIGANGMGSVLYNDDYYDLTNDAIQYVNKKYEEGI